MPLYWFGNQISAQQSPSNDEAEDLLSGVMKVKSTTRLQPAPANRLVVSKSNKSMRPVATRPTSARPSPPTTMSSGTVWAVIGVVALFAFAGGGGGRASRGSSSKKGSAKKESDEYSVEALSKRKDGSYLSETFAAPNKQEALRAMREYILDQGAKPKNFKLLVEKV